MTRLIHFSAALYWAADTNTPTEVNCRAYYDRDESEFRSDVTLSAKGHAVTMPAEAFKAWCPGWEGICDLAYDDADLEVA